MKICIFGSCISRDVLNFMEPGSYELQLYSARASFGSLFSKQPFPDKYSPNLSSPFQQHMLQMEIRKEAIERFELLRPDVILVDLIDERFDLVLAENGGVCTYSNELRKSGFKFGAGLSRISSRSEEFFSLWHKGWTAFVEHIDRRGLSKHLVVNRSYYGTKTINGTPFDAQFVHQSNDALERMYRVQEQVLDASQFITYSMPRECPDDHQWGPSPFHFDKKSNEYAAKWLKSFMLLKK